MASFLKAIFPCLPIGTVDHGIHLPTEPAKYQRISEKSSPHPFTRGRKKLKICSEDAASSIVSAMLDAEKPGPSLDVTIQSLVHQAGGWSEYLATKILTALEAVLKAGTQLNPAMQKAYDKACEAAKVIEGFAADHPVATAVFCTVVALGVLVVLAPYAVEWLGFAELGPVEGKFLLPVFGCDDKGILMLVLDTGTWAAAWQSTYRGLVPKGSLFSYFQRLGMTWKHV